MTGRIQGAGQAAGRGEVRGGGGRMVSGAEEERLGVSQSAPGEEGGSEYRCRTGRRPGWYR